ncbi:MAG: hypothetical protein ACREU8_05955 [Gammaproteobacteria bacterium]
MESCALLFALLVIAYLVYSGGKRHLVPAAATDWFVVFDVNAESKVLSLWFYPVVGFHVVENGTIAVTSRPAYTTKLASTRPAKKVDDGLWGVSVSYGRWYRDGAPIDELGNPELQDSADFCATVENYLLGEFKLHTATPVPIFYQGQIQNAVARSKQP